MKRPLFTFLILLILPFSLFSQKMGNISGQVTDNEDYPLQGANVYIKALEKGAVTDRDGDFKIGRVPEGIYEMTVSFIGFDPVTTKIELDAGESVAKDFVLEGGIMLQGVTVGSSLHGQARALNQQKTAPNIKNVVSADLIGRFPDPNVAEALQRIPGISVQRDQGEGRYVQIRGTDPSML